MIGSEGYDPLERPASVNQYAECIAGIRLAENDLYLKGVQPVGMPAEQAGGMLGSLDLFVQEHPEIMEYFEDIEFEIEADSLPSDQAGLNRLGEALAFFAMDHPEPAVLDGIEEMLKEELPKVATGKELRSTLPSADVSKAELGKSMLEKLEYCNGRTFRHTDDRGNKTVFRFTADSGNYDTAARKGWGLVINGDESKVGKKYPQAMVVLLMDHITHDGSFSKGDENTALARGFASNILNQTEAGSKVDANWRKFRKTTFTELQDMFPEGVIIENGMNPKDRRWEFSGKIREDLSPNPMPISRAEKDKLLALKVPRVGVGGSMEYSIGNASHEMNGLGLTLLAYLFQNGQPEDFQGLTNAMFGQSPSDEQVQSLREVLNGSSSSGKLFFVPEEEGLNSSETRYTVNGEAAELLAQADCGRLFVGRLINHKAEVNDRQSILAEKANFDRSFELTGVGVKSKLFGRELEFEEGSMMDFLEESPVGEFFDPYKSDLNSSRNDVRALLTKRRSTARFLDTFEGFGMITRNKQGLVAFVVDPLVGVREQANHTKAY